MSIETSIVVTIASVAIDDDYRVALRTHKKLTSYSPDEALELADELVRAAEEARAAWKADAARSWEPKAEVVHLSPVAGKATTRCCGRLVFDLALSDRLTNSESLATCGDGPSWEVPS